MNWYYADGGRQVGPLARRTFVEDLSRVKDGFLETVSRSITRRGLLRPTDSVLVAVSSVVPLHATPAVPTVVEGSRMSTTSLV